MAAMLAKCLFTALFFLLMNEPLTGDQVLKAVSIGGFTWDLSGSQIDETIDPAIVSNRERLQTPNCQFANVAMVRQQLENNVAHEHERNAIDQQWMSDRTPFDLPICFLNATCPNECCYFVEHEITENLNLGEVEDDSVVGSWEQLPLLHIQEFALQIVQITANRMTPMISGLAKGAFRTATATARHARFPAESFGLRLRGFANKPRLTAQTSDSSVMPIVKPVSRFQVPIQQVSSSKMLPIRSASFAKMKSPERMDAYWNYYADCDRWNVIIAGKDSVSAEQGNRNLIRFAWFENVFASASKLDLWLTRAIGQLESQGQLIGKDLERTWQEIEFRLLEASFANSIKSSGDTENPATDVLELE